MGRKNETIQVGGQFDLPNIKLRILATGGSVADAVAAYRALMELQKVTHISAEAGGYIAPCGMVLMQAADKGCRVITQRTMGVLQQSERPVIDIEVAEIFALRSEHDAKYFLSLMAANRGSGKWFTAIELLEMGLADVIVENSI